MLPGLPAHSTVLSNLLFKLLIGKLGQFRTVIAWFSVGDYSNPLAIATAVSRWSPVIMIGLIGLGALANRRQYLWANRINHSRSDR